MQKIRYLLPLISAHQFAKNWFLNYGVSTNNPLLFHYMPISKMPAYFFLNFFFISFFMLVILERPCIC